MSIKRVIITGPTGAVGIALLQKCIENKIFVTAVCHRGSRRINDIPSSEYVNIVECDLSELESLTECTEIQHDVFYHLAWAGTAGPVRDDMYLQAGNIRCALDAVSVARKLGCHTFIGAGSQAEYGRVGEPLKPDTPVFPETGYGIAKLCAGHMTKEYAHQLGLRHIWVRILSVYGPNDGSRSMVMSIIDKLRRGEVPQCTEGKQIWDYLYSGDAAEALWRLGKKGVDGKTYILGSGIARPLAEYIKDICDVISPGTPVDFGAVPYGAKQVMYLCADISELEKDTGWRPHTQFRDGIKQIYTGAVNLCNFAESVSPPAGLEADISDLVRDINYRPQINFEKGIKSMVEAYSKQTLNKIRGGG